MQGPAAILHPVIPSLVFPFAPKIVQFPLVNNETVPQPYFSVLHNVMGNVFVSKTPVKLTMIQTPGSDEINCLDNHSHGMIHS